MTNINKLEVLKNQLNILQSQLDAGLMDALTFEMMSSIISKEISKIEKSMHNENLELIEEKIKIIANKLNALVQDADLKANCKDLFSLTKKVFIIGNLTESGILFSLSMKTPQVKFALARGLAKNCSYAILRGEGKIGSVKVDGDYNSIFIDNDNIEYSTPSAFCLEYDLENFGDTSKEFVFIDKTEARDNSYYTFEKDNNDVCKENEVKVLRYKNKSNQYVYFRSRGFDSLKRGTKFSLLASKLSELKKKDTTIDEVVSEKKKKK